MTSNGNGHLKMARFARGQAHASRMQTHRGGRHRRRVRILSRARAAPDPTRRGVSFPTGVHPAVKRPADAQAGSLRSRAGSREEDADASGRTTPSSGQNPVPSAGDPRSYPTRSVLPDGSPSRREAASHRPGWLASLAGRLTRGRCRRIGKDDTVVGSESCPERGRPPILPDAQCPSRR